MKTMQIPDLTQWKTELLNKRIPLINSVLGIVMLYYLLKLTVVLLPPTPIKIANDPALMNSAPINTVPHIGRLHIFGVYQIHDATTLPIAQMGLTLQGILYDTQPAASQALIATANGNTKTYKIGDNINGATIKQILPQDVILDTGGSLQRLPLIRPNLELTHASS